jgi:hypothetical protein
MPDYISKPVHDFTFGLCTVSIVASAFLGTWYDARSCQVEIIHNDKKELIE